MANRSDAERAAAFFVVLLLAWSTPQAAGSKTANDPNRTVEFEDLGFTLPLNPAGRPMGLGGAYTATGDDVHSLIYNPAGLARIKRIEISLGLQQERKVIDNVFYGTPTSIDTRNGGFNGASAAYPFPTYRGSLVAAFGVYRLYSGYFDIHNSGANTRTGTIDHYLLQQTGSIYSYNFGIGTDLSPVLSGGVSVFVLDGTIDALTQYDFTFVDTGPQTSVFVKDDASVDIDGYGGRVGVQFFILRQLRGGVSFTTPVWIRTRGAGKTETTTYLDNAIDAFEQTEGTIEDKYLLPYRVNAGLTFVRHPILVAFEVGYADWTEAAIDRKRFRDSSTLETLFHEVFDYHAGIEATLPWAPLRVRAGYSYRPYPLSYLQTDRIENTSIQKAQITQERHQITFGLGGLVGRTLAIDGAIVFTDGRRSNDPLADHRSEQRILVSASYRL